MIEGWDESDGLSASISRLHEADPELVYPTLVAWNRSADPWLRRQSLVSLFYYHRQRRRVPAPERVFPLVERLLPDPDKFVQKGLGWTLREAYNADPAAATAFIEMHLARLSGIAFAAATEKLEQEARRRLIERRAIGRATQRSGLPR